MFEASLVNNKKIMNMQRVKMQRVKINNYKALVFADADNKVYTIAYNGNGGAIISHPVKEEAIKRWIAAMELSEQVSKVLTKINKQQ